jgi:hypothetical protein
MERKDSRLNTPASPDLVKRLSDWRIWRIKKGFPIMTQAEAVRTILTDRLDQDLPIDGEKE